MKTDLVLEGGGTKLPGLIGAYASLTAKGFEPSHIAGTSAGAIVGAAIAAGYDPQELRELIFNTNFEDFLDGGRFLFQRVYSLLRHNGMYKGDEFEEFMREVLAKKGVKEFGDLRSDNQSDLNDGRYRWTLKVIASDIAAGKMLTLPNDAVFYDIDPDRLDVAAAIRMSMSIPFFFRPVRLGDGVVVDGGILSNYPIWLFDSDGEPDWPTFGLLLQEDNFNQPHKVGGVVSFFKAMLKTMMQAHDRRFVRPEDFLHRTIGIPVGDISSTEFDLTHAQKQNLYHSGYQAATTFLNTWSWEAYREWAKRVRGS